MEFTDLHNSLHVLPREDSAARIRRGIHYHRDRILINGVLETPQVYLPLLLWLK